MKVLALIVILLLISHSAVSDSRLASGLAGRGHEASVEDKMSRDLVGGYFEDRDSTGRDEDNMMSRDSVGYDDMMSRGYYGHDGDVPRDSGGDVDMPRDSGDEDEESPSSDGEDKMSSSSDGDGDEMSPSSDGDEDMPRDYFDTDEDMPRDFDGDEDMPRYFDSDEDMPREYFDTDEDMLRDFDGDEDSGDEGEDSSSSDGDEDEMSPSSDGDYEDELFPSSEYEEGEPRAYSYAEYRNYTMRDANGNMPRSSLSPRSKVKSLINKGLNVKQSSLYDGRFVAKNAINGNTKSLPTHTKTQKNPWWEVNIPKSTVTKIRIWNRKDCCKERLYGAKIWLKLSNGKWKYVATYPRSGAAYRDFNIGSVKNVVLIKIKIDGNNKILSLAEVQAWGYKAPAEKLPKWKKVGGLVTEMEVSADGSMAWGIGTDKNIYYCTKKKGWGKWTKIDGKAVHPALQVSANRDGTNIWVVNTKGQVWQRDGIKGEWKQVDLKSKLKMKSISITANAEIAWGVATDRKIYYREKGFSGSWTKTDGAADQISVSADGNHVWVSTGAGSKNGVYHRYGIKGSWKMKGHMKYVAVSPDGEVVWGIKHNDEIYFRNGPDGEWKQTSGRARLASSSDHGEVVFVANVHKNVYYSDNSKCTASRDCYSGFCAKYHLNGGGYRCMSNCEPYGCIEPNNNLNNGQFCERSSQCRSGRCSSGSDDHSHTCESKCGRYGCEKIGKTKLNNGEGCKSNFQCKSSKCKKNKNAKMGKCTSECYGGCPGLPKVGRPGRHGHKWGDCDSGRECKSGICCLHHTWFIDDKCQSKCGNWPIGGIAKENLSNGQPCDNNMNCASLLCSSTFAGQNTCEKKCGRFGCDGKIIGANLKNGQSCNESKQCESGCCSNDLLGGHTCEKTAGLYCRNIGKNGSECFDDSNCKSGRCAWGKSWGVCKRKLKEGEVCPLGEFGSCEGDLTCTGLPGKNNAFCADDGMFDKLSAAGNVAKDVLGTLPKLGKALQEEIGEGLSKAAKSFDPLNPKAFKLDFDFGKVNMKPHEDDLKTLLKAMAKTDLFKDKAKEQRRLLEEAKALEGQGRHLEAAEARANSAWSVKVGVGADAAFILGVGVEVGIYFGSGKEGDPNVFGFWGGIVGSIGANFGVDASVAISYVKGSSTSISGLNSCLNLEVYIGVGGSVFGCGFMPGPTGPFEIGVAVGFGGSIALSYEVGFAGQTGVSHLGWSSSGAGFDDVSFCPPNCSP